MLQNGADINELDRNGTPLLVNVMDTYSYFVSVYNTPYFLEYYYPSDFINFLIEKGANINKPDSYGKTPLMTAILSTNTDAVATLLKFEDVKLNARDNEGMTALMHAVTLNYYMKKDYLVSNYFKVSWIDREYYEMENMFRELRQNILRWLLKDNRVDVNLQDNNGRTALIYLIQFYWKANYIGMQLDSKTSDEYKLETLSMLLAKGADINIKDKEGKSPLIYAVKEGDERIQNILVSSKYEFENSIEINTYKTCWAVLISSEEARKGEYGWWSIWHEKKQNLDYFTTPHTFKKVLPGTYTVVIYDPASKNYDPVSGNKGKQSDGIVLRNINIEENSRLKYNFNKSDFIEWNCLSCPWLYIFNGSEYERFSEVLKDKIGITSNTNDILSLPIDNVINDKLLIKIQEEKDEITYIDRILLKVKNVNSQEIIIFPRNYELSEIDGEFITLQKGESLKVDFDIPDNLNKNCKINLHIFGYYEPKKEFLQSILKYLSSK